MKVIDAINKLSNGEININTKLKFEGTIYNQIFGINEDFNILNVLNREIEIIEEPKEELEEIEFLTYDEDCTCEWKLKEIYEMCEKLIENQNKIIKQLKGDDKK